MKHPSKWAVATAFTLAFALTGMNAANAEGCGSDDAIIIPTHNWSSQIVMST